MKDWFHCQSDIWTNICTMLLKNTSQDERDGAVWWSGLYDRNLLGVTDMKTFITNNVKAKDLIIKQGSRNVDYSKVIIDQLENTQNDKNNWKMFQRVTVLGDWCHPMSMFKGQGCNQSLQDWVLLWKLFLDEHTKSNKNYIDWDSSWLSWCWLSS